ncbi:hypothetical protein ACQ86N_17815 [Puia sp. P3]|uniref:hypothetical protein n=1 Tax=Puia sp. P3 TaxID=3423952 RepID=UPI003D67BA54
MMKIAEELEMTTINDDTSMLLETDDQTMEDLGIFSRRSGGGIFDLYNHTHTRGAKRFYGKYSVPAGEQGGHQPAKRCHRLFYPAEYPFSL